MRVRELLKQFPRHEDLPDDREPVRVGLLWYWGQDVRAVWEAGRLAGTPKPINYNDIEDVWRFCRLYYRVWYDVTLKERPD